MAKKEISSDQHLKYARELEDRFTGKYEGKMGQIRAQQRSAGDKISYLLEAADHYQKGGRRKKAGELYALAASIAENAGEEFRRKAKSNAVTGHDTHLSEVAFDEFRTVSYQSPGRESIPIGERLARMEMAGRRYSQAGDASEKKNAYRAAANEADSAVRYCRELAESMGMSATGKAAPKKVAAPRKRAPAKKAAARRKK